MADLVPEFPIVTAEKVRPNLSGSEIAAPFRDMAEAMSKGGAALTDVSEELAQKAGEEAGRKSVRTADDGSLVVDDVRNPFIVGPAAKAYERAAKLTQLAQIQPQVETALLQLRLDHQNDPAGFTTAAKAYGTSVLDGDPDKGVPAITDPHIRGAVSDFINTNTQHNLRTSLIETNHTNTQEALQTYQARIKDLNEQMSSLARQGGTGTPEYLALAKNRATFWNELQADPRFKFSKERADLEINEAWSNDKVQEVIGNVQRQYQKDGDLAKAKQSLMDRFWGPGSEGLNLTATKRDHGVAEGIKALSVLTAQDHEAIAENRSGVGKYLQSIIVNPRSFDEGQHGNMLERSRQIGDYKSMHELEEAKRQLPIWSSIHSMSAPERADALADMRRGLVPTGAIGKTIEQEAARVGLPPDLLKRVVQIESSGNPNANRGRDDTKYKGLFQLSPEEFAKYGPPGGDIFNAADNAVAGANALRARYDAFQSRYGRAPTATELYLSHNQGEGGLAAHLANPDQPAWQNMLSTAEGRQKGEAWAKRAVWGNVPDDVKRQFPGGVESVTSRDLMRVWQGKVERTLVPGQQIDLATETPTTRLWQSTIKETQTVVDRNAKDAFAEIKAKSEKGAALMPGEVEHFTRMAVQSGDQELLIKAEPLLNSIDINNKIPPGTSLTALKAEQARLQSQGLDSVARQTLDNVIENASKADERLHAAPLIEGANRGWIGAVGQLDTTQPQAFGAEIASREKKIGVVRQNAPDMGPISALSPQEGKSLATALTTGDPKVAGQLLDSLRLGLTPDNWRATMASEPIKNAVTDMARSNDPVRMTQGMQALDKLWTANAPEFQKSYGEHTLTRLLAWKGLQALSPEMQVERLNRADDPFQAKGREEVAATVDKEFKSTTPADVAYQLGGSWGIPVLSYGIPFVSFLQNQVTGATPAPPVDAVKAGAMAAEFKDTVKALRTYDVAPDTAKQLATEKMKTQWQPTRLVGVSPTLMKYAPETYYPQVDGSHDWMQRDIDNFISGIGTGGNVLEQAQRQYPILKQHDIQFKLSPGRSDNMLESWQPGEPGDADYKRPSEFPLNKFGIEVFDQKTRPIDILGDVVSHHLINVDPKIKQIYSDFTKSITPHQEEILHDQYEYAKEHEDEKRPYEQWKEMTGLPAFFRGYPFQQWPDEFNKRAYTPGQLKQFDEMMGYLGAGGTTAGIYGPKAGSKIGIGGEIPEVTPGWRLKNIVSDAQTEQEIARGQPPSYRLHIVDANGQDQFVRDPATGQDRIRWNPASAQAEYQAKQKQVFGIAGDIANRPFQTLGGQIP